GAKRMRFCSLQAPPRATGASARTVGAPPESGTRRRREVAKEATASEAGDQKGRLAPSVPSRGGDWRGGRWRPPRRGGRGRAAGPGARKASVRQAGEMAAWTDSPSKRVPGGGVTWKRRTEEEGEATGRGARRRRKRERARRRAARVQARGSRAPRRRE